MSRSFIFALAVSLSIPSGMLQQMLPDRSAQTCPDNSNEVPYESSAESATDVLELLKLTHLALGGHGVSGVVCELVEAFQTVPSPCATLAPEIRDSHFCRPPPTCI